MKNKRQTYHLNITEPQMKHLQSLVKKERQRIAEESSKRTPEVARLQGLQKALERSIYFFNKHIEKANDSNFSEEEMWFNETK